MTGGFQGYVGALLAVDNFSEGGVCGLTATMAGRRESAALRLRFDKPEAQIRLKTQR